MKKNAIYVIIMVMILVSGCSNNSKDGMVKRSIPGITPEKVKKLLSTYDEIKIWFEAKSNPLGFISATTNGLACSVGRGLIDCSIVKIGYKRLTTVFAIKYTEYESDDPATASHSAYVCTVKNRDIVKNHPSKKLRIPCRKK